MMRRRWIIVGAVLLASVLAAWSARGRIFDAGTSWAEVRKAVFERRVQASGELRSADSITVGCPSVRYMWEYTITSLIDEGKHVEPGELLLSFDGRKLRERLEVKSSQLETARKELEKTRLDMQDKLDALILEEVELKAETARLARELNVPENLKSRLELEKAKLDAELADKELKLAHQRVVIQRKNLEIRIGSAERKVASLEQSVKMIREDLGKLNVTASRQGYVVHVKNWSGEKPKAGESVWQGMPLLEIADLSSMEVAAEVAEPDAGYVEQGQAVEVRLDAAPERMFKGRIERLGLLFRTKSKDVPSKVFDAMISIDDPDPELMRPGMAVNVEIIAPSKGPVMQIPEDALVYDDQGPKVEVRRKGGALETGRVVLGSRWNGKVIVEQGLEPGDRVRLRSDGT